MPRRQLRTANYSAEARNRLGEAVERARIDAGYRYRTEFCRAHGIKNLRGLELLEQGLPGVGQAFLFEVARALPGWTEDTPRIILEGGPIPAGEPEPVDLRLVAVVELARLIAAGADALTYQRRLNWHRGRLGEDADMYAIGEDAKEMAERMIRERDQPSSTERDRALG